MSIKVEIKSQKFVEKDLKKFKRLVERSGILSSIKKKQAYEKPSEKRKRKLEETVRKRQKRSIKSLKFKNKI